MAMTHEDYAEYLQKLSRENPERFSVYAQGAMSWTNSNAYRDAIEREREKASMDARLELVKEPQESRLRNPIDKKALWRKTLWLVKKRREEKI